MNSSMKQPSPRILVVGDLMIDHYLWGECSRISPEAPVQVVAIGRETQVLGGAGNVVNNLKQLGARVTVLSVVGQDASADELKNMLAQSDIDGIHLIEQSGRTTSKKTRIIAAHQQVLRYDSESTEDISPTSQQTLIDAFQTQIDDCDAVILSDYGKGVLTDSLTQSLIQTANAHHKKVLIDPKGDDYRKYTGAYLLTPNKKEAIAATKIPIRDRDSLNRAICQLKEQCRLAVSLITLSEDGIACLDDERNELKVYPTVARDVFDVTGAGDTVIAALAFCLSSGRDISQSIIFANLAAGVVVGKVGNATATIDEIMVYEASLHDAPMDTRIKTAEQIQTIAQSLIGQNKKIVFTNGCFDILHIGHVRYLEQAKTLGDVLIVGVNSDDSVRRLKGAQRPINPQADRAAILAALKPIDYVVVFDEDTPYELIKQIQPHTLVKGGDYANQKVVGDDIAQEVKLIDFVDGKSTSQTIEKIRHL